MTKTDRPRCAWANSTPDYVVYHDEEWGTPLHGESALFERLSLEAFQSGLSWLIIMRKRPTFRAAFADFDVDSVAALGPADETRLLADAGIVRNRAKIEATIANARASRDAVPEGQVIDQSPKGKTTADIGSTVKLVIAQKAAPTITPTTATPTPTESGTPTPSGTPSP